MARILHRGLSGMNVETPGPHTTIDALVKQRPELRRVLQARGIDTCCGGGLTLAQAAELRGMPLEELLAAIAPEPSPAPAPADPEGVVRGGAGVHRPFLRLGLACTLLGGAAFGAYNLLVIHWALGVNPPSHNAFHATFQVLGFLLPFIMGVSYHAVPRLLSTELERRDLVPVSFWALTLGILLRGYGQFGSMLPATLPAGVLGAAGVLVGIGAWAAVLAATARRAPGAPGAFRPFVAAGVLWWLVAGATLVWAAARAFRLGDPDAAFGNEAFYAAALFGAALPWVQGMLARTAPALLGLPAPGTARLLSTLATGQAGACLAFLGALLPPGALATHLANLGLLAVALSVALLATWLPLLSVPREPAEGRRLSRTLGGAVAFGLLFSALAALHAVLELSGIPAAKLLHDGARHAFGLGFLTLAVLGMAGRILPAAEGTALAWPRALSAGTLLVAAGALARQAQVAAALGAPPELLRVSGMSGGLAVAGVALSAAALWRTMSSPLAPRKPRPAPAPLLAAAGPSLGGTR